MQNSTGQNSQENHVNLTYKLLKNQTQRVIKSHQRFCQSTQFNLTKAYQKFHSQFFEEVQNTHLSTLVKNFHSLSINGSPQKILQQIIDNFRLAFNHIQWMINKQTNSSQFKNIRNRKQFDLENNKDMVCRRCESIIAGREIQYQKMNIEYSQFQDPYNLFSVGMTQFEDNQQIMIKLVNQNQIDDAFHRMKLQGHIQAMKKRIYKRSNQLTEILNQFQKYYVQIVQSQVRGSRKKKSDATFYQTFEGCYREVMDILSQKIYAVFKKLKLGSDSSPMNQQIQVNLIQEQYQKYINKNNQLQKQVMQKKQQINEIIDEKTKLSLLINQLKTQISQKATNRTQLDKQNKYILKQIQRQKIQHKATIIKLQTIQKQNQQFQIIIDDLLAEPQNLILSSNNKVNKYQKIMSKSTKSRKYVHNNQNQHRIIQRNNRDELSKLDNSNQNLVFGSQNDNITQQADCINSDNNLNSSRMSIQSHSTKNKNKLYKRFKGLSHNRTSSIQNSGDEANSPHEYYKRQGTSQQNLIYRKKSLITQLKDISQNQIIDISSKKIMHEIQPRQQQMKRSNTLVIKNKSRLMKNNKKKNTKNSYINENMNETIEQLKDQHEQYVSKTDKKTLKNSTHSNFPNINERINDSKHKQLKNRTIKNKVQNKNKKSDLESYPNGRKQRTSIPIYQKQNKDLISDSKKNRQLNQIEFQGDKKKEKYSTDQNKILKNPSTLRERLSYPVKTLTSNRDHKNIPELNRTNQVFNQTLGNIVVQRSQFLNTLDSSMGEHYGFATADLAMRKQNQITIDQIFTVEDVKNLYFSIEGALQHQKSKKISFKEIQQNLSIFKISLKVLTVIASLHSWNQAYYEAIKNFLVAPFQTVVSQHNYLYISKSSINEVKLRQALNKIFWMHRLCSGKPCQHIKQFIGKIEKLCCDEKDSKGI